MSRDWLNHNRRTSANKPTWKQLQAKPDVKTDTGIVHLLNPRPRDSQDRHRWMGNIWRDFIHRTSESNITSSSRQPATVS